MRAFEWQVQKHQGRWEDLVFISGPPSSFHLCKCVENLMKTSKRKEHSIDMEKAKKFDLSRAVKIDKMLVKILDADNYLWSHMVGKKEPGIRYNYGKKLDTHQERTVLMSRLQIDPGGLRGTDHRRGWDLRMGCAGDLKLLVCIYRNGCLRG